MCGIAGIYRFERQTDEGDLNRVRRMTEALRHRGPDAWGVSRLGNAILGHRRLSIIDLSAAGNQPLSDADGLVWITYNGEIYNYPELRRELIEEGIRFRSASDTEVLVAGYREWGIARLLERLRGMFAFALLDRSLPEPRLILARDRLGIKPLYYYWTDQFLLFASEIRGLRASGLIPASIDRAAFLSYLQWGTVSEPRTAVEGVRALPGGHYLPVVPGSDSPQAYWSISTFGEADPDSNRGREDYFGELQELLEDVVRVHQVSDVPVGVFLSGGIDSSSLALMASSGRDDPIQTISVAFDESGFNEEPIAELVSRSCRSRHHRVRVSGHDFVTQMEDVFKSFDQPTIDGVNTYYVSWAARRCGLKVVLSGLGSDELFLGYRHFHNARRGEQLCRLLEILPVALRRFALAAIAGGARRAGYRGADRLGYLVDPGPSAYYRLYRGLFPDSDILQLTGAGRDELRDLDCGRPHGHTGSFLDSVIQEEFGAYLGNQLLRDADAMSMAHSLEVRVPFLDHLLVERVMQWPHRIKLGGESNKPLLVGAMGKALPREVWDRPKQGFVFPLPVWLKQHNRRLLSESLQSDWLEPRVVERIWEDFMRGRTHWTRPWAILVWNHWQRSLS